MCRVCVCLLFFRLCQFEKCFVSIRTKNKLYCFLFPCLALHTHTHTHTANGPTLPFSLFGTFLSSRSKSSPLGLNSNTKGIPSSSVGPASPWPMPPGLKSYFLLSPWFSCVLATVLVLIIFIPFFPKRQYRPLSKLIKLVDCDANRI